MWSTAILLPPRAVNITPASGGPFHNGNSQGIRIQKPQPYIANIRDQSNVM